MRRGVEFAQTGRFEDALIAFRAAAAIDPKSAAVHGNIGTTLIGLGRPNEAVAAFREATRLAPKDGNFQTSLCGALGATEKYDEAVKACEEGVRLNPESAIAHAALISAMDRADRPDTAMTPLVSAALTRFRENEQLLVAAAEYHSWRRNRQMAVELWEQLTRLRPSSPYYLGRFAEACVDVERESEAIVAARRTLEMEPNNPYAQYAMGRIFLELGQHGDASNAFRIAVTRKDRLPYAQYYYGVSESRAGRVRNAIEAFRQSVADNPGDFNSLAELGRELTNNAQYEEAVPPLKKAVSISPNNFEAKVSLGLALFESAQHQEGIRILEDAERMKPGNEIVAMFLRVSRSRQEYLAKIDEMKQWVTDHPKDTNVRINLIETLGSARRMREAEPYFQEVFALGLKETRDYVRLAVAYVTAGDYDRAISILRKSFDVGEDPGAYLNLANIYAKRGQADDASAAYAKVLQFKPDAGGVMKLYADHLRDNGKRREALEMYRRSLALKPTFGPTLSSAAILSAKLDDMDAAKVYLSTLKTVDPDMAATVERCLVLLRYLR
jgi:tetratricopeptide (TPR) repeat protein